MSVRKAEAVWDGSLKEGKGTMKFSNYTGPYTWASRFEEASGTNPEELIGAAHAGCFSMALSSSLGKEGFSPRQITTRAEVHLERVEGKARITRIHLDCQASVPEISLERFQEIAEAAKKDCPVSAALAGPQISLTSRLV